MNGARIAQLAQGAVDDVDVAALAGVRRVLELVDPVPAGLVERSLLSMSLASLDAQLMDLLELDDLHADAGEGALRHQGAGASATTARTVTFTSASLSMMITLTTHDGTVRVDGWVSPPRELDVVLLRTGAPAQAVTADAGGRLAFAQVARGLVAFVLQEPGSDRALLTTPIIEI